MGKIYIGIADSSRIDCKAVRDDFAKRYTGTLAMMLALSRLFMEDLARIKLALGLCFCYDGSVASEFWEKRIR